MNRSEVESDEEIVFISIVLPSGEGLSVSLRDLLYPTDFAGAHSVTVENTLFCPIRLRFSGNSFVVLGRPFLHAQTEVVLDAKSNSIYVFPRIGSDTVEPFIEPTPLLPTFSYPGILPDTVRFAIQTTEEAAGLVLFNINPIPLPGIRGTSAWIFYKFPFGLIPDETPVRQKLVPGKFSQIALINDGYQLELMLVTSGEDAASVMQVVIVEFADKLEVRILQRSAVDCLFPIDELDIPDPEVSESDLECSICLEQMGLGSSIQRLRDCSHTFHFACIKGWLETRNRTCPCCRTGVNRRPSPSV